MSYRNNKNGDNYMLLKHDDVDHDIDNQNIEENNNSSNSDSSNGSSSQISTSPPYSDDNMCDEDEEMTKDTGVDERTTARNIGSVRNRRRRNPLAPVKHKSKIKRLLSTRDDRIPSTVESHLRRWRDIYNQKETLKQRKDTKYDMKLLRRLGSIISVLFYNPLIPVVMMVILLGLAVSQTYTSKFTGTFLGSVYGSLFSGDKEEFKKSAIKGLLILILSAVFDATIKMINDMLAWRWRHTLVLTLQTRYFSRSLYYRLIQLDDTVDNPDQRLTDDIDQFCQLLSTILSQLISAPLVISYYTYLTWHGIGWYAPAIVGGYFIFGYIITKQVMSPLVSFSFQQDRLEGDFRYLHLRVRTFSESIALQHLARRRSTEPTAVEEAQTRHQFTVLMKNKMFVIAFTYLLNLCSDLFTYLSPLVNYCIIAIPIFLGWQTSISSTNVTEFSYNCIMLANGFSQYINVSTNISQMSSYIQRISTMIESCEHIYLQQRKHDQEKLNSLTFEEVDSTTSSPPVVTPTMIHSIQLDINNNSNINHSNSNKGKLIVNSNIEEIVFDSVTYYTPKKKVLYSNISFKVERGNNLLIMGPSGCGKSSLMRVINGLWSQYTGTIRRPSNNKIFFLSQQPYLIFGSLEDQIVYPYTIATHKIHPEDLRELFDRLEMGYLIDREQEIKRRGDLNDLTHNWLNQLSPGEQQIISILRMFYHRPMFAMMDESTSSIPHATEDLVYQQCKQLGITVVSVGHRESLIKHHQQLLLFDKDMNWSIKQL